MRWRTLLGYVALAGAASACSLGWPDTKMVPVADYQMASGPSISGAPAYTAGPSYYRTASHDGSTFIVTCDGRMVGQVPWLVQNC